MVRIPTHRAPTHPGEILLEEYLKPLGLTQSAFAERIGVPLNRVNELVKGKRGVTPDTALRLEAALGASAQSWLNAQLACDLYEKMHSPEAAEIKRIRRVRMSA
jgi:antitoxin HigA-1